MKIKDLKSNNNKHLTFADRCKIEECINKGFRKYQTANEIKKVNQQ